MNKSKNPYHGHRFLPEIIGHAVWLYHRFTLSFRDIEELLAIRGIQTSYESVRRWCLKFPLEYGKILRKRQGKLGDIWFLDEVFLSIGGKRQYLFWSNYPDTLLTEFSYSMGDKSPFLECNLVNYHPKLTPFCIQY